MAALLNGALQSHNVSKWLTTGKTILAVKDRGNNNDLTNFHLITCLPIMRKLLTRMMAEEPQKHLEQAELSPDKQRGCGRKRKGTKDQLLKDKMVIKICKKRFTDLALEPRI